MKYLFTLALSFLFTHCCDAQPASLSVPAPRAYSIPTYSIPSVPQIQIGSTAQDVANNIQSQHGLSNYLNDRQRQEQQRREMQQIQQDIRDAFPSKPEQQSEETLAIDTAFAKPPTLSSEKYAATKPFWDALLELQKMVDGSHPFKLTEAVYLVENATFRGSFPKDRFINSVKLRAAICTQIMQREGLPAGNSVAMNYAIQKLYQQDNIYHDPKTGQNVKFPKLVYDFDDYRGDSSYQQMFVSKLMYFGKGQCHSMPLLYLMIAEQMGAEAYLSLSPSHSFIRFPDAAGNFYNFETTSGSLVSDAWVLQSGYVTSSAIKNHIYLEALSPKQLLSLCLYDLALGYQHEFGFDGFTEQVLKYALPLDPMGIQGNVMLGCVWEQKMRRAVAYYHVPSPEALPHYPVAAALHKKMLAQYAVIDGLGYQEMPKAAYEIWLQSVNDEKKKRAEQVQAREHMPFKKD